MEKIKDGSNIYMLDHTIIHTVEGRLMVRKSSLERGQKLGQICWGTEPQECREEKTLIFTW